MGFVSLLRIGLDRGGDGFGSNLPCQLQGCWANLSSLDWQGETQQLRTSDTPSCFFHLDYRSSNRELGHWSLFDWKLQYSHQYPKTIASCANVDFQSAPEAKSQFEMVSAALVNQSIGSQGLNLWTLGHSTWVFGHSLFVDCYCRLDNLAYCGMLRSTQETYSSAFVLDWAD